MFDARCAYEHHPVFGPMHALEHGDFSDDFSMPESTILQDVRPTFGSQFFAPMHTEPSLLSRPTGVHPFSAPFTSHVAWFWIWFVG